MNIVESTPDVRWYGFLSGVVSFSVARPRYVGILATSVVLTWWLHIEKLAQPVMAVVVASMLVGVACVRFILYGGRDGAKRRRRWSAVLFGSTTPAILAGWLIGGSDALLPVLVGLSLAIPILYTFGKIGCHQFGCCGWGARYALAGNRVSLQALEAVLSSLLALGVFLFLWGGGDVKGAIAFFMIGHGMQRIFSRISRQKKLAPTLLAFDTGVSVIAGTTVLWCAAFA